MDDDTITLSGLVKSYRDGGRTVPAVRGVDVTIRRGETVALLGPNGAGKTTTIDMLLGLSAPEEGSVEVFGRSPRAAVDGGLVGGMLQTGALIEGLTVRELVTMMASLYPNPRDVAETIGFCGLESFADQRTNKLSGGQTQRVRFALAVVANPQLMVLDEPTVALDVEGRRDFWSMMRGYAEAGTTVLFATHYLEEADANADRVVLMAHGKVVADGSTSEIKARVGARTIRATLPGVPTGELQGVPGVTTADRRGDTIVLRCEDSDAAIRELLVRHRDLRDIEIAGAALEDAFLALTADDAPPSETDRPDAPETPDALVGKEVADR